MPIECCNQKTIATATRSTRHFTKRVRICGVCNARHTTFEIDEAYLRRLVDASPDADHPPLPPPSRVNKQHRPVFKHPTSRPASERYAPLLTPVTSPCCSAPSLIKSTEHTPDAYLRHHKCRSCEGWFWSNTRYDTNKTIISKRKPT